MKNIDIQEAKTIAAMIRKKYGSHIKVSAVFDELVLLYLYNTFKDYTLNEQIKELLKTQT